MSSIVKRIYSSDSIRQHVVSEETMHKEILSTFVLGSAILGSALTTAQPLVAAELATESPVLIAARRSSRKKPAPRKTNPAVKPWHAGLDIPYKSWLPKHRPHRVLLCVHGLGFSSKSFERFGRFMAARGIAVYAIDVRGFGSWRRNPETSEVDFEACITDLENALKLLRSKLPGTKIYLVGESMGGAISLAVTSRYSDLVDGLISCVPSGERYGDLKEKIVVGAHYIEDKDKPIDLSSEVIEKATSDEDLQNQLKSDPTIKMDLTPEELKQFNAFMRSNKDNAALIEKTPVLMMAGFEDRLVKPKGTIELFNDITCPEKILVVVGDGEHLLLEESELTRENGALIYNWLVNH